MEPLTFLAIAVLIGAVISNIAVNLASEELYAWLPRLSRWLVSRAVARLPSADRASYEEQFLADLADVPGHIGKVVYAFRIFLGSGNLARELKGDETRETDYAVLRQAGGWAACSIFLWGLGNAVWKMGEGNPFAEHAANFILYLALLAMAYVLYLRKWLYKQPGSS